MQAEGSSSYCSLSASHLASRILSCGCGWEQHSTSRSERAAARLTRVSAGQEMLRQHAVMLNEAARIFFADAWGFGGLGRIACVLKKVHAASMFRVRQVRAARVHKISG